MNYGWLREIGSVDFAGGTVVHITSGFSALVAASVIGNRRVDDLKNVEDILGIVGIAIIVEPIYRWNSYLICLATMCFLLCDRYHDG